MLGGACGATVPMANPLDRIRHAIPPFDQRRLGDSRYRRRYEADLLMQRRWLALCVEELVTERQALRLRLAELLTPGHGPVGTASPCVPRRDVEVRVHEIAVLLRAAQSTLTTIRREVAGLKEIRRIAQFDSAKAEFLSSAVSPLIPRGVLLEHPASAATGGTRRMGIVGRAGATIAVDTGKQPCH